VGWTTCETAHTQKSNLENWIRRKMYTESENGEPSVLLKKTKEIKIKTCFFFSLS
jgi:hypothetical protein